MIHCHTGIRTDNGQTHLTIPLHGYQQMACDFIKTHPYCGLFLDMGLGKTLITLYALYQQNPHCNVLVIAPKNIARSTWMDEIAKWNLPIRTQSLLVNEKGKDLTKKQRQKLYDDIPYTEDTVYFINREKIVDLIDNTDHWYFPCVVIDELQSFKSYKSARFKALKAVRPYIQQLIGLTGTPTPNGLEDLWAEIYLMDEGERLGRYISYYRQNWFYSLGTCNGIPINWTPQYGAEEDIYRRINDLVISVKNTELKLPPVTFVDSTVYMSDKEYKTYRTMMKERVLDLTNGEQVVAKNAATLTGKLSQMASGAIYIDEDHNYETIHTHKIDQCAYIIENTDSPVMIAYHFKSDLDMLKNLLPKACGITPTLFDGTPEMLKAWNERKIPILLIQPQSAGHGLNFQHGGHTLIWYTIPWSLEEYQQTNARLNRQGQTEPVLIHHLLTDGTIDKRILKCQHDKDVSQQALLDAVRVTIE